MADKILVIDLQAFPGETAKLIEACEEWGCFRIMNYEEMLPESLLHEMKQVVKLLFALPEEIKRRNCEVIPGSGYMAPSANNPLNESFGLYDAASPQDAEDLCSKLDASPMQRDMMLKYAKAVNEVMKYIANKIGEGLGVKGFSFEDWCCQLRINKYNFTPESVTSSGLPLHTDSSFLTLLHDDKNIGGLQVMRKSGEFEAVDPCPDTLVVNLGDIAPVWSNGRLLSLKHRVICREAGTRLTIASFLLGPRVGMVEAPPELVDSDHPRLFSPFIYQDYRSFRASKNVYTGETVDCFRIQTTSISLRAMLGHNDFVLTE